MVLLVAAGLHTFLTRKTSKPPKWMGELETAHPKLAFRLGFLLLGVFPTDILTAIAVGGSVAGHNDAWWRVLPFVFLTLLVVPAASRPWRSPSVCCLAPWAIRSMSSFGGAEPPWWGRPAIGRLAPARRTFFLRVAHLRLTDELRLGRSILFYLEYAHRSGIGGPSTT